MVKRLLALFILPAAVFSIGVIPSIILSKVKETKYVFPQIEYFSETVEANGEIVAEEMQEVYLSTPVFANRVSVSVGDAVLKGQLLATIDQEVTKAVAASGVSVPKAAVPSEEAIADLAEQYGIPVGIVAQYIPKEETQVQIQAEKVQIPKEIEAPISGVVTQVGLQQNALSSSGVPLVTIANMEKFKAKLQVLEEDIQKVALGDSVVISSPAFSANCRGVISKIYPVVQSEGVSSEKTVAVEVEITTGASQLKPGFTANGTIFIGNSRELITIPYEAISQDSSHQEYVYVYEQGKAVRRNISTGQELLYTVEVTSGLTTADIVLMNPEEIPSGAAVCLRGEYYAD